MEVHHEVAVAGTGLPGSSEVARAQWIEVTRLQNPASLAEAREKIETWRKDYNQVRPHSALGYQTPEGFAARGAALRSPTAPCEPPFASLPDEVVM